MVERSTLHKMSAQAKRTQEDSKMEYNSAEYGFQRVVDSQRLLHLDSLQQKGKVGGSCIRDNSTRLIELWSRGHHHLKMVYLKIKMDWKLIKRKKYKMKNKYISHFMIYCDKRNQFIDVSNGRMRMIDVEAYSAINQIVKSQYFEKKHLDKELDYREKHNIEYQGIEIDIICGMCNKLMRPHD